MCVCFVSCREGRLIAVARGSLAAVSTSTSSSLHLVKPRPQSWYDPHRLPPLFAFEYALFRRKLAKIGEEEEGLAFVSIDLA